MKKWLVAGLLVFFSLGGVWYGVKASDRGFFLPAELGGVNILIDPGHGGEDGGASAGEIIEKDITLNISHEVRKLLEKKGATVQMTREKEGDAVAEHAPSESFGSLRSRKFADLKLRESMAIESKPDMFISVHVNAIPEERWRGAQVFYHPGGHPDGKQLATSIQDELRDQLKNTEREAMKITGVYLLKKVPVPAVLVETGFLSNPEERKLLSSKSYQKKVAAAIVDGIVKYQHAEEQ
ncbi:N-acetylmuramoyl-L-alanine amidase [Sporosarcina sp. P37]|uniref:N-acetylmuramoyl-L-alanine amidase n=1 Tax=unclassified Sporosarcina TaxID=2647733 RepID=UPI0009C14F85|nr:MULTISPECIES: N-acetylmuramoyl-L-alanine amidase [unclassified Sporosarcina]ARD48091.1 N-acetylmuramoyl-L-alanine amidase [Sporosarcina sp. P33]ARK24604.1 N-acetylmuramoyl-L-alanine amidase [Sporosarcina sp. P37]PID19762.1 N-acetylmuramoyl-L-alanine amidase [Sporosarcina sp. P35]